MVNALNTVLALLLCVGCVAFGYGASVGFRGKVLHSDYYGQSIPDHVKVDPHRRAQANDVFKTWSLTAAILLVIPTVWVLASFNRDRSIWELAVLAAYVLVVVVIGLYPHEKLKRL